MNRHRFDTREFQTFLACVHTHECQLIFGALLQGHRMAASSCADIQCASFFGEIDVRVNQLSEPLAPVRSDVEILKKGEFLFRFSRHQKLTTEDTENTHQIKTSEDLVHFFFVSEVC